MTAAELGHLLAHEAERSDISERSRTLLVAAATAVALDVVRSDASEATKNAVTKAAAAAGQLLEEKIQ